MSNEQYNRPVWNTLDQQQRRSLLEQLKPQLPEGFELDRMETFSRYGATTETGVFTYKGSEFVFVPGDTVTLGLQQWPDAEDEATWTELRSILTDIGLPPESADSLMNNQLSPVREAIIRPLLAERKVHSVSWEETSLDDLDPEEDQDIFEQIEIFKQAPYNSYELDQSYRLERDGDNIRVWLFYTTEDAAEWAEIELDSPFQVPTEDEWEYLNGGGTRTMFPWGNQWDYTLKLRYFEKDKAATASPDVERPYDLELANGFGLYFLGDPYQVELTLSPDGQAIDKGGDGGMSLCGGGGMLLGYLPVGIYYRSAYQDELDWTDRIGNMHYRRVIRL